MVSTEGSNCSTNMGSTRSEDNDSNKEETPLILGLPDDIAILCLARVPRTYHATLKCVSKRWRKLVCGEEWRIIRKKYNLEETWIYAFCQDGYGKGGMPKYCCYVLDPYESRRRWKRLKDLPTCIIQRQDMKFEVLGSKAYFIGGRDFTESEWSDSDSEDDIPNISDEVHCYDGITNSWSKAAPLSTPRCNFASEVLDGKVYAVGSDYNPDGKNTWEAYDPVTNIWKANSDPHGMDDLIESITYDGKLYVWYDTYYDVKQPHLGGAVYDPSTGIWQDIDCELLSGWNGTSVVADGRLYSCCLPDYKLMTWEEDKKKWIHLVDLAPFLTRPDPSTRYHLVAVGKRVFLICKELFTLEFDLSNVGKGGVLPISDVTGPVVAVRDRRYDCPTLGLFSGVRPEICKGMTI